MSKPILDVMVQQESGITIAVIQGPVDSATIDLFKELLDPVCLPKGARVVLDCRHLSYLNSRAIGLIMKYHRGLMLTRGRLALCQLNEKLVRTLDLLQMGKSLVTFPTREEALAALR
jgi:anti-sigma B factor antagonist